MINKYNKYYEEDNYFGNPYPGLVDLFNKFPKDKYVLDLGCGQGRDSLALGRMGYKVIGIDVSDVGIYKLNEAAKEEGLGVKGLVVDFNGYYGLGDFDIVLMDSVFHFYKRDYEREKNLLLRVFNELKRQGILVVCIYKGEKREKTLKDVIGESGIKYEVLYDDYTDYPEHDGKFLIYAVKKI
jgi:SAM-dependent methyltransferase